MEITPIFLRLGTQLVALHVDAEDVQSQIQERWFPRLASESPEDALHISLRSATNESRKEAETIPVTFRWHRSRPFWGDLNDSILSLSDGVSMSRVDYAKGSAEIWLDPATLSDPFFFHRTFFLLPVTELLRTRDLFFFHGAALVKDHRAIALIGDGGSGKSTLSAALLQNGWKIVGDDTLLLQVRTGKPPELYPLEPWCSFAPAIAHQMQPKMTGPIEGGKVRVRHDLLPEGSRSEVARLTDLFVLAQGEASTVASIAPGDAFAQCVRDHPLISAIPALAPSHMRAIEMLLKSVGPKSLTLRRMDPLHLMTLVSEATLTAQGGLG